MSSNDDPPLAKQCLWTAIIVTAIILLVWLIVTNCSFKPIKNDTYSKNEQLLYIKLYMTKDLPILALKTPQIIIGESNYLKDKRLALERTTASDRAVIERDIEREITEVEQNITKLEIQTMIVEVFGVEYGRQAIEVVRCESNFRPDATNFSSQASGLFQIIPQYHDTTIEKMKNPEANIIKAYEIFKNDNFTWKQWSCQP